MSFTTGEAYDSLARIYQLGNNIGGNIPPEFTQHIADFIKNEGDIDYQIPNECSIQLQTPEILGYTALHLAVIARSHAMSSWLLENEANSTIQGSDGFTATRLAAQCSCAKKKNCFELIGTIEHPLINMLLNAQVKASYPLNPSCNGGISHLHVACMTNNVSAVELFLQNGVSADEGIDITSKSLPGYAPLHVAARYCSLEVIELLLNHGADQDAIEAHCMTPLHLLLDYAIQVDYLLMSTDQYGQDLQWFRRDLSKVESAIELLSLKADGAFDYTLDRYGLTYFHVVCATIKITPNDLKNVKDINAAINSNSPFCPGYTGLHFAAHFSLENCITLMKKGANVLAKDAKGITPFDICLKRYDSRIILSIAPSSDVLSGIKMSNGTTSLVDILRTLNDKSLLKLYLMNNLDADRNCVALDSPLWPGRNILHVAVELAKCPIDLAIFDLVDHSEQPPDCKKIEHCCDTNVSTCLDREMDVSTQDLNGTTPLHLAFRQRKWAIVKKMLNRLGPNSLDHTDSQGLTHLHIMVCENKLIDGINPVYVNWQVKSEIHHREHRIPAGSTALHMVLIVGNGSLADIVDRERLVKMLLGIGADPSIKNDEGFSSAHLAVLTSSSFVGEFMSNPDFLAENTIAEGGFSNLHAACLVNNLPAIESLLESGADVNVATTRDYSEYLRDPIHMEIGYTPLHIAVAKSNVEAVELLIKHGANVAAESESGLTAVNLALRVNWRERNERNWHVKEILRRNYMKDSNRNPDYSDVEAGMTLLYLACSDVSQSAFVHLMGGKSTPSYECEEYEQIIAEILKYDMDVDRKDEQGKTSLHLAVENSDYSCMYALLLLGADVNVLDEDGKTAFEYFGFDNDLTQPCLDHLAKLYILGLEVSTRLSLFLKPTSVFNEDMEKLKRIQVIDGVLSLRDLLTERFLEEYPTVPAEKRQAIDDFARDKAMRCYGWNKITYLVNLQLRKAKKRLAMAESEIQAVTDSPV